MKHYESFTGRIGYIDKEVRELQNGNCVVNFSVAETPRIKKGNDWVDGTTIWTNVAIFGDEARNLHRSVKPGTVVTVFGVRKADEYIAKDTNEKVVNQSVIAEQVSIGITKFNYVEGVGNVNYAKDRSGQGQDVTQNAQPPQAQSDPFTSLPDTTIDDDPFGGDDDPFGLGS